MMKTFPTLARGFLVLGAINLALTIGLGAAGMLLFSGNLYLRSLAGIHTFHAVTPLGGSAFILEWLMFAVGTHVGQAAWRNADRHRCARSPESRRWRDGTTIRQISLSGTAAAVRLANRYRDDSPG